MERLIDLESIDADEDSYWVDLFSIPYNKQLYEVVEPRPIHYCIIDAHQYKDFELVRSSFEELKNQNYR